MALQYDAATMSTGVAEIDEQHKELIRNINLLVEKMKVGRGQDELAPLLDFLVDYSRRHFAHEERCMASHQCPAAGANKAAHAQFLRMVESFRADLQREGPTVTLVLRAQRELGLWIRNHIVRTDTQLRACVKGAVPA